MRAFKSSALCALCLWVAASAGAAAIIPTQANRFVYSHTWGSWDEVPVDETQQFSWNGFGPFVASATTMNASASQNSDILTSAIVASGAAVASLETHPPVGTTSTVGDSQSYLNVTFMRSGGSRFSLAGTIDTEQSAYYPWEEGVMASCTVSLVGPGISISMLVPESLESPWDSTFNVTGILTGGLYTLRVHASSLGPFEDLAYANYDIALVVPEPSSLLLLLLLILRARAR